MSPNQNRGGWGMFFPALESEMLIHGIMMLFSAADTGPHHWAFKGAVCQANRAANTPAHGTADR
jgi:hypothetical protein